MSISITDMLRQLHSQGGSDLHLVCGSPAAVRVNGDLSNLNSGILTEKDLDAVLSQIASPSQRETFRSTGDLDLAWEIPELARYRVNFYKTLRGTASSLREIPRTVPGIDELGLPGHLRQLARLDHGLVLVTGPTGSGKSTTIAALVDYANQCRTDHILTIEDPIEFVYEPRGCFVSQREVGMHTKSFAAALRAALREDPDIIVVGEMRDAETISLALEAAETGHLVFATLHTESAAKSVDRIIDTFPAANQQQIRSSLSEALQAVLSCTLMKRADGFGRVLGLEILLANSAIRNLIREGKTYQIPSVLQTNRKAGMWTLDDQLEEFYLAGVITDGMALLHAQDRERINRFIRENH